MTKRIHDEGGWAVATAIVLLTIMLTLGLATFAMVDRQTERAGEQRKRESALNLGEGVLYSQAFVLTSHWPSGNNPNYPATCTSDYATTTQCPNRDTLARANSATPDAAQFQAVDYRENGRWETIVRDDYGALEQAYIPTAADAPLVGALGTCPIVPCSRDFNRNRQLWVETRTMVRGRPRRIVAKMKLEELSESAPAAALTAGALTVSNAGNHGGRPIVDGGGSVYVRCQPDPPNVPQARCTSYRSGQLVPPPANTNPPPFLTPEQIERFEQTAKVNGTYYTTCPPEGAIAGAVVFVESCNETMATWQQYQVANAIHACAPTMPSSLHTPCANPAQDPGFLIVRCGAMTFRGNWTYIGVIYMANGSDGSCAPRGTTPATCPGQIYNAGTDSFHTLAGFGVWGSVVVDGNGCARIGSNGGQLMYLPTAIGSLTSYGAVGLVQNTWRELKFTS